MDAISTMPGKRAKAAAVRAAKMLIVCTPADMWTRHLSVGAQGDAMRPSVPDVLQEPFGGNGASEAGLFGQFIHLAGDRKELRPLQVAAFRIGDLVGRRAALSLAVHQVGERHPLLGQEHAVRTAARMLAGPRLSGARFPSKLFVRN